VALLGLLDYLTGVELSAALFYLVPISCVAWFAGKGPGLFLAVGSAVAWRLANNRPGEELAGTLVPIWNMASRLGFFIVVSLLLARLKDALAHERALARTDPLTGALGSRAFLETAAAEMDRMRRYGRPFTVIYLDADNFKAVNDSHGHAAGDDLLRAAARAIGENLRATDTVARLGGDEFALLLPETDEAAANEVILKIQSVLNETMIDRGWPVTFSFGVLTCEEAPRSVDEMVKMADDLMYEAKRRGKHAIQSSVYRGPAPAAAGG